VFRARETDLLIQHRISPPAKPTAQVARGVGRNNADATIQPPMGRPYFLRKW